MKIKTALVSVYDKTGLDVLAAGFKRWGIRAISTGNTAKFMKEHGVEVTEVSDVTKFPEMLDGRVKTLHPKIHGGILARRDKTEHVQTLKKHGIPVIDLVVINLYPFEKALSEGKPFDAMIEMIDVGGPTMLRAAAKNHAHVASVCDIGDYSELVRRLDEGKGSLDAEYLKTLAAKVFRLTSEYDGMIAGYMSGASEASGSEGGSNGEALALKFKRVGGLRYGENPHQKASLYRSSEAGITGLTDAKILWGKELSYNNYLDLDAAWSIVSSIQETAACVVKHNNPCGVAVHKDLAKAFELAFAADPLSAFGGIVGLNTRVDAKTAQAILDAGFLECVIAPAFDAAALKLLQTKKNLRLVQLPRRSFKKESEFKKITGALLVQDANLRVVNASDLKVATKKKPSAAEIEDLVFGFNLLRFVKSNAIMLVKNKVAVGIGMGQPSRVDSVKSALSKAGKRAAGSVLVSDGFFPKPDSIQFAAKRGVRAVAQPGGSIQDPAVIAACDKAKISMVFTGVRHFSH